jgi:tetratricopeptide (TPR) repeat protein
MTRSVLHSRAGAAGCLLLALMGWPAQLLAQTPAAPVAGEAATRAPDAEVQRAEAYAAEAFEAYGRKEYESAVDLYRKAYEISPTADILYNIARIYDVGMKDRSRAIEYYHRYVADSEAEATHVEIARERLTQLEARERPTKPAAAAPATLAAIEANEQPPARPALVKPARPPERGGAAPALDNDGAWTPLQVGAIVAGTVGLVGIGLGAGFGVAALSDASTARDECDGNVCSSQRGVDAVHAASKNADIATVGFALGGTLLATSIALLWIDGGQKPNDSEPSIAWNPIATDSQLGLSVSRSW